MNSFIRNRDLIGGSILAVLGTSAAFYSVAHYDLGRMRFIGPGAFPLGASVILAILGLLIVIGRKPEGEVEAFDPAALARNVSAMCAFALLVQPFGVVPAVAALTFISMASRRPGTLMWSAIMTVVVSVACIAFFVYGLGLRADIIGWPF
jgi:hypothetical protein